jgi:hypothetical protein
MTVAQTIPTEPAISGLTSAHRDLVLWQAYRELGFKPSRDERYFARAAYVRNVIAFFLQSEALLDNGTIAAIIGCEEVAIDDMLRDGRNRCRNSSELRTTIERIRTEILAVFAAITAFRVLAVTGQIVSMTPRGKIRTVVRALSRLLHVPSENVFGRARGDSAAHARFIAMAIEKMLHPKRSLPEIGHLFDRHHATVLHGLRRVTNAIDYPDVKKNTTLARKITFVCEMLEIEKTHLVYRGVD